MRDIVLLGGRLLIFAVIAGVLLGATNAVTKDPIEAQKAAKAARSRGEVLKAESFEQVEAEPGSDMIKDVYRGSLAGQSAGYAITVESVGFGGPMEIMVGVGVDGKISGVKVMTASETPGLGAKASDAGFGDRFVGRVSPIKVSKTAGDDVQAITGATITTRAVADAVEAALAEAARMGGIKP